jgi:hypothetical protein
MSEKQWVWPEYAAAAPAWREQRGQARALRLVVHLHQSLLEPDERLERRASVQEQV